MQNYELLGPNAGLKERQAGANLDEILDYLGGLAKLKISVERGNKRFFGVAFAKSVGLKKFDYTRVNDSNRAPVQRRAKPLTRETATELKEKNFRKVER